MRRLYIPSSSAIRPGRLVLILAVVAQGCAAALPVAFDYNSARYVLDKGTNEIAGRAAIISKGGYERTCENDGVSLLPETRYWNAWRDRIVSEYDGKYAPRVSIQAVSVDEAAKGVTRHVDCDGSGRFRFERVADGKYYVFSTIFWLLRWQQNGGGLIQEVEVHKGKKATVSLIKDWRTSKTF